jgi:hypothetical protein
MVARGENERHIAAAGVSQGSFCGLRSGGASAKMPFEIPIPCRLKFLSPNMLARRPADHVEANFTHDLQSREAIDLIKHRVDSQLS